MGSRLVRARAEMSDPIPTTAEKVAHLQFMVKFLIDFEQLSKLNYLEYTVFVAILLGSMSC